MLMPGPLARAKLACTSGSSVSRAKDRLSTVGSITSRLAKAASFQTGRFLDHLVEFRNIEKSHLFLILRLIGALVFNIWPLSPTNPRTTDSRSRTLVAVSTAVRNTDKALADFDSYISTTSQSIPKGIFFTARPPTAVAFGLKEFEYNDFRRSKSNLKKMPKKRSPSPTPFMSPPRTAKSNRALFYIGGGAEGAEGTLAGHPTRVGVGPIYFRRKAPALGISGARSTTIPDVQYDAAYMGLGIYRFTFTGHHRCPGSKRFWPRFLFMAIECAASRNCRSRSTRARMPALKR